MVFRFKIIIANVMFDYLAVKSYFNKWTKLSIGIDFGIGIDQNSWYRTGIVSKPKKLVSPITTVGAHATYNTKNAIYGTDLAINQ